MSGPIAPATHPEYGLVDPMPFRTQPQHVWAHLYNADERWEQLTGEPLELLVQEAEEHGVPALPLRARGAERARLPWVDRAALDLLYTHHDGYYAPAYMAELREEGTSWGEQIQKPGRLLCATPRGVLISIGCGPDRVVLTAFRPDLPLSGVKTIGAYRDAALRRWNKQVCDPGARRAMSESEERTPAEVAWERALELARRAATARPGGEGADDLPELRARLEPQLRFAGCLDGITAAFQDQDEDVAADRLLLAEELLEVARVVGLESAADEFAFELEAVLALAPATFTGLLRLARSRASSQGLGVAVWESLLGSQVANALREAAEPALRPEATQARRVIGLRAQAQALLRRLGALSSDLAAALTIEARPVAVAGATDGEQRHEVLVGPTAGRRPRVFVAFSEDDEAVEVDAEELRAEPGGRWSVELSLDAHEGAWIVVAEEETPSGSSLADLVRRREGGDQGVALNELLIPPARPRRPASTR